MLMATQSHSTQPELRQSQQHHEHWIPVKLRSLTKARRNMTLEKAKVVRDYYQDFWSALAGPTGKRALPNYKANLISSRVGESNGFEFAPELNDLRNKLRIKLNQLEFRIANIQRKNQTCFLKIIHYPQKKLLEKKLDQYRVVVKHILRTTQQLDRYIARELKPEIKQTGRYPT
jgi:hypothetical protein